MSFLRLKHLAGLCALMTVFCGISPLCHAQKPMEPAGTQAKVPVWKQQTLPVGTKMEYKQVDGKSLSLYVLEPPAAETAVHPAIVFFHGGGWTGGNVGQFNPQATYIASKGMVAIQVQYRLMSAKGSESPQVCGEDAKSAMRWVRAHAKELHIDPNRIAAAGGSAGGFLATFTALVPAWDDPADDLNISPKPNALVLFFPAIDISPAAYGNNNISRFGPDYKKLAPMEFVSASTPPTIILAGAADKQIAPDSLRQFKNSVEKAGGRCDLIFYAGQPHGFANGEPYMTITLAAAAHFLESLGYLPASTADPVPPTKSPND